MLDGGVELDVSRLEAVLEVTLSSPSMEPKSIWESESENSSEVLGGFAKEVSWNTTGAGAGAMTRSDMIRPA